MEHIPFVSVLVPAHNEASFIKDCLDSIRGTGWPDTRMEIIVVDNNSTDETAMVAAANGAVVIKQRDGCIGRIRNVALAKAKGDYIAYVDADCTVPATWLSAGIGQLQKDPEIGAVGGPCLSPRTGTWVERGLGTTELNTAAGVQAVKSLATSSFIASRKLIVEVGGFNEKLRSGEDSELSERLVARGYSLISHPGSHVTHYGYPRSLTDVYRKQIWHGSNQLEASSGWSLTLALSHLTLIALLLLVSALPVALLSGRLAAHVAFAALCGLFAPPCVYALKRMRTQSASPLQLSRWFLIGAAYFLGRAHGLLTNYWRRLTT